MAVARNLDVKGLQKEKKAKDAGAKRRLEN